MTVSSVMAGSWKIEENLKPCLLPQKVASAFAEALQDLDSAGYEPLLYCASQLVSGTNYMLICKQTMMTREPETHIVKMVIYVPLQGPAVINDIALIL